MMRIFLLLGILSFFERSFVASFPPVREYTIKRDFFNQRTNPKLEFTVYLKEHGKQYRVQIDANNGWAMNVQVTTYKSKVLVAKMVIPSGANRSSPTFQAAFEIRNETNQNWINGLVKRHELGTAARLQYLVEWTRNKIYVSDLGFGLTFYNEADALLALISAAHSYAIMRDNTSINIHEHGYPDLVFLLTWAAVTDHSIKVVRDPITF